MASPSIPAQPAPRTAGERDRCHRLRCHAAKRRVYPYPGPCCCANMRPARS